MISPIVGKSISSEQFTIGEGIGPNDGVERSRRAWPCWRDWSRNCGGRGRQLGADRPMSCTGDHAITFWSGNGHIVDGLLDLLDLQRQPHAPPCILARAIFCVRTHEHCRSTGLIGSCATIMRLGGATTAATLVHNCHANRCGNSRIQKTPLTLFVNLRVGRIIILSGSLVHSVKQSKYVSPAGYRR
jgi:hypothetical protein